MQSTTLYLLPRRFLLALTTAATINLGAVGAIAQHQHHDHDSAAQEVRRPTVFLDKSPRIVEYQLKRLSNDQLLLVERATDDARYAPVYRAIAVRPGMPVRERRAAVEALSELQSASAVEVLLTLIEQLDAGDSESQRVFEQLVDLLGKQAPAALAAHRDQLLQATASDRVALQIAGFVGLLVAGASDDALRQAQSPEQVVSLLNAVALQPVAAVRRQLKPSIIEWAAEDHSLDVRRAAIAALSSIPPDDRTLFALVGSMVGDEEVRDSVVRALLRMPAEYHDPETAHEVVQQLVELAEATPASQRTTESFVDAMQLADRLMAALSVEVAREYRSRIRAVAVRVVRIKTVEEEMRYDVPYFAVEAGRPVEVWLENEDLMPHNLVVTAPGALRDVAMLAAPMQPTDMPVGKQYVPDTDLVLHATDLVPAEGRARLTFTAPSEVGEYPYVCTFPQHWMRMNGVMVVVEDLDAWMQNPTVPDSPVGSNRSFVQAWTVEDFEGSIEQGMRGRSSEIGARLFAEATCLLCHKIAGEGGAVGPDLTDVFGKWKNDPQVVLREILDPSHTIDPKYAASNVLTIDGQVITGIVIKEDDEAVTLIDNPEAPKPTVVPQDAIERLARSPVSLMPKGLLDQYTQDEIYEILAYLKSVQPKP